MNDAKTKQQVIEKITNSTNVLVTVSNNPSVDALSSAIALTLILNKLGKHTTAIFSGQAPPAITFLDPGKTFETSIDSLRDFIIALDKEKADHLRYKVEGDVVKIFITPYRTTISSNDLEFSQGDYNVELVLALGVENQAHLDGALEAHGSILHDAAVITVGNTTESSSLGSIDWRDDTASSLSEMLVTLTESLQSDAPLLDQEVATALLTGIVAETDRFSNPKTSSKVMTMAAQLMAAGADQQLIAAKLQESHEIGNRAVPAGDTSPYTQPLTSTAGTPSREGLTIGHAEPIVAPVPVNAPVPTPVVAPQTLNTLAAPPEPVVVPMSDTPAPAPYTPPVVDTLEPTLSPEPAPLFDTPESTETPPVIGRIADAYALNPEEELSAALPSTPVTASLLGGALPISPQTTVTPTFNTEPLTSATAPYVDSSLSMFTTPLSQRTPAPVEPAFITQPELPQADLLAATPAAPEQPEDEISKHAYLGGQNTPSFNTPINSTEETPQTASADIFSSLTPPVGLSPTSASLTPPTIVEPEKNRDEVSRDEALSSITNQPQMAQPFSPAPGITLPPPPPLPDFGALPSAVAPAYALDSPVAQPAILGDIVASPPQPVSNDPGQFKIPGQY
jgi:hypothetical protein